jgi:hypothetical protein
MSIQNKIEQYLKDVRELEKSLLEVQSQEILPFSFFSSSIDILNRLRSGIYEIEAIQLQMMQEHLVKNENDWTEMNEPAEPIELMELKLNQEHTVPAANVLADTIGRKISGDFAKSLSLNDRFMFQRDLFQGNANEMNQALSQLNALQSLSEVIEFLSKEYTIPWNSDSGIALKELLDKRFA